MDQIITVTTDFGDGFATSQLRVIVAGLRYKGHLVENHDVAPYSIIEGAYGIWQLAKFCPPGTVHVGVVDPGVGSERAGIVIKTRNFWWVGPDNGLLWPGAERDGIETAWKLAEEKFSKVAGTFHGRDIFIKTAVWLAQGRKPENFGCQILGPGKLHKLEFEEGQVVHIDSYGNAKIWGQKTFGLTLVKTFSDVNPGEALILNGSSETLEIAVNQGNAAQRFELKLGQVIEGPLT